MLRSPRRFRHHGSAAIPPRNHHAMSGTKHCAMTFYSVRGNIGACDESAEPEPQPAAEARPAAAGWPAAEARPAAAGRPAEAWSAAGRPARPEPKTERSQPLSLRISDEA